MKEISRKANIRFVVLLIFGIIFIVVGMGLWSIGRSLSSIGQVSLANGFGLTAYLFWVLGVPILILDIIGGIYLVVKSRRKDEQKEKDPEKVRKNKMIFIVVFIILIIIIVFFIFLP